MTVIVLVTVVVALGSRVFLTAVTVGVIVTVVVTKIRFRTTFQSNRERFSQGVFWEEERWIQRIQGSEVRERSTRDGIRYWDKGRGKSIYYHRCICVGRLKTYCRGSENGVGI